MILLERFTDMNTLEEKRARKGGEGRSVWGNRRKVYGSSEKRESMRGMRGGNKKGSRREKMRKETRGGKNEEVRGSYG